MHTTSADAPASKIRAGRRRFNLVPIAEIAPWPTTPSIKIGKVSARSWLKPIYSGQRQHALKDRHKADQNDEKFEKVRQTTVTHKIIDGPETNCADDAYNQNSNQN
jgi:hypothetical protein